MRKTFMHFLGFLLTIGILMSVTSPSFATVAEHSDYYDVPAIEKVEQTSQPNSIDPIIKEQQEIEIAQKSYQSLSDEQKVYFEQIIASYPELVEYHQRYVNPYYNPSKIASTISSNDPVKILMTEIAALALPAAVVYSINATAVGMAASVADGPLPVGEILFAAAAASFAITCALNWDIVSDNWDKLVLAFQHAFTASVNNIIPAFNELWVDSVKEYYNDSNPVALNRRDKSITFDGSKYNCRSLAETSVSSLQTNSYYPAIIGPDNKVYICIASVPEDVAKLLVIFGNEYGVVFAKTQSNALNLCKSLSPVVFGPEYHGKYSNQIGYWRHYHVVVNQHAHIWYNNKLAI